MYDFLSSFTNTNGVAYPNTAAVNSSGGGATDGTEFVKIMVDDIWGFFQKLLNYTDDTPAGTSEVTDSQLLNSIKKITSNLTELTTNTTHTVEEWNKRSMLVLSSGCTVARIVGGTGADESNRILVQNNNTVTVEIDFGASANQEEIIMQPGQWVELVYDSEATKFVFLKSNMNILITTAIDYTIGDWVPSGAKILVNCNTAAQYGTITVTLPTMADNVGKWYEIEHGGNQGLVIVDGEGAETLNFKGEQKTTNPIYSSGMGYKYYNNGTDWVMSGKNSIIRRFQNRSDWTNVNTGNGVGYDNKSAAVDLTGMVITESTSGFTAVIIEDTGGTGASGILYYYELPSSFTFWTDGRVLTASDGTTCDVNEISGSSKNQDYNFYHGFGLNISSFNTNKLHISTDGTDNNSYKCEFMNTDGTSRRTGFGIYQNDNNSLVVKIAINGYLAPDITTGDQSIITISDYFCNYSIDFSA